MARYHLVAHDGTLRPDPVEFDLENATPAEVQALLDKHNAAGLQQACHAATIGFMCDRPVQPEHTPCCSSHGKPLCCYHYGRWHFCEGACSPEFHGG